MTKGWSDAARKAAEEARAKGRASGPSFADYSTKKLGDKWTLAKATAGNKARYGRSNFVKPAQFAAVQKSYAKDHPQAALAHFGALGIEQMNRPKVTKGRK